ncbi:MAG: hypothetical protein ACOCP4_03100 [Candidatus Woesearchaeota archaeon]
MSKAKYFFNIKNGEHNIGFNQFHDIISQDQKVGFFDLENGKILYPEMCFELENPLAIAEIEIFPEYRKRGFFSETFDFLENIATKKGFSHILLRIDENSEINKEILKFIYCKRGYEELQNLYSDDIYSEDVFLSKRLLFNPEQRLMSF